MGEETKYLVSVNGKTATMSVLGKATYLNCRSAGEFFARVADMGCKEIVLDCGACTGMDSTFLGMTAGAAMRMRKSGGEFLVSNPSARTKELIENLGLFKLVKIVETPQPEGAFGKSLPSTNAGGREILKAHENLVAADSSNLAKFEDVISFLKKETDNS